MPLQAALTLTVAMPGLEPLTVGLTRLREDIQDWRPFWRDRFMPFFYEEMTREFITEGGQTGDPWAELSPAYAQWKRLHYASSGILVRSGVLKASVTAPDAPDSIARVNEDSLEVGTSVPYARYHQYGTYKMPQRPILRVDEAFMGVIGKSLAEYVHEAWLKRRAEAPSAAA